MKTDAVNKIIKEEIQKFEGVADKYAEKQFHIPDPNAEMNQKALSGMPEDNKMGELVGRFNDNNKIINIYMNPKSLVDFDENIKAVSNNYGDLFVAQIDGYFYHSEIVNAVNSAGKYNGVLYNAYDENENVTWHRIQKTNDFGWSVSYKDYGEKEMNQDVVQKQIQVVKQKNPIFNFIAKYWMLVRQERYDARNNINNQDLSSEPVYEIMKEEIQNLSEGYYDNEGVVRLYHRVGWKQSKSYPDLIRSVMQNGLVPYDGGEIGEVIWLSNNYRDYGENGKFVVALDFDTATNGITNNKYEIVYEGGNAYAHQPIPFADLVVVKIPVAVLRDNHVITNVDAIEHINDDKFLTPEAINNGSIDITIFADVFNTYVQPNIDIDDFISKLDDKTKLINIGV